MNRVRRPGGVRTVASLAGGRAIGHDFEAFARAVGSRYNRSAIRWSGAERFYLRQASIRMTTILHRHRTFVRQGAQRLDLHLRIGAAGRPSSSPSGPAVPAAGGLGLRLRRGHVEPETGSEKGAIPVEVREARPATGDPFVAAGGRPGSPAAPRRRPISLAVGPPPDAVRRRYARTEEPVEMRSLVRRAGHPARVEEAALTADAVVLRRPRLVPKIPFDRRELERVPPHEVSAAGIPSPPPTQTAAPQLDLANVTNQVMREIDRRIGAWRERTGRV